MPGHPLSRARPQPLAGGPPPTANSGPFTPTLPGTYRWIASYSGDANYNAAATLCNDANESSLVSGAVVTTNATPTVTIGSPISDTATVTGTTGAAIPTGTVVFTLFGPDDATCATPPVFTSAAQPLGGGVPGPPPSATASSGNFTPTVPGAYRWIAAYSGDAVYPPATSLCNDANETSVVNRAVATIVTSATPTVPLGTAISDTATVTGGPAPAPTPTGTVVFTLFGPGDPTCTGAPIFTSAAIPLAGGPPPTANSGPFTPTAPGSYQWVAAYSGDVAYDPVTSPCGAVGETSVVTQLTPTIVTSATPAAPLGNAISDTATVTGGPAPAPAPTGTVVFTLFGPDDATCAGPAVFTSGPIPLAGGPPPTANSGPFTPTLPGTYRWIATYSGDVNYVTVTSACNAANESSLVSGATIVTSATPAVTIGSPISDTATVTGTTGAPSPTGTVVFTLFGPANPTCTGAPIFTSPAQPLTPAAPGPPPTATAASGPFTPTAIGTYNWVAVYSGDAVYPAATSPCGAPNEASVVNQSVATIVTSATTPVPLGTAISDTATVTGGPAPAPAPTGTVTFTLFGPANPTCTGAPIFTSGPIALAGGPPPTATSGTFTPTAIGTYNWVAVYSGDANYPSVTSPCGAPNEASVVAPATPTIVTSALTPVGLGNPIRDVATVTGAPAPAPAPTGTVTFTLFGPANPTCTGAPIFTSGPIALAGGPPPTATSGDFVPTAVGTYNWVAVYSGDANYVSVTSPCGAPNEASVVNQAPVNIATVATPTVTIGSPINDTATVTSGAVGAPAPTGTVTFTLFGPANPTCTGAAIFTSGPIALAGGPPPTATSADFVPTAVGTYQWIAVYSGDANYPSATSPCGAPNEASVVGPSTATIVTTATPTVLLGGSISDTATVTGGPAPAPRPPAPSPSPCSARPTPPAPAPPSSPAGPSRWPEARRPRRPRAPSRPPRPAPTSGWPSTAATPTTRRPPARAARPTRRRW